jgi:hypothetical protein
MEKGWVVNWYCENHEPVYKYTIIGWNRWDNNREFCWQVPEISDRYDMSAANKITRNEMDYLLKYGTEAFCGGESNGSISIKNS